MVWLILELVGDNIMKQNFMNNMAGYLKQGFRSVCEGIGKDLSGISEGLKTNPYAATIEAEPEILDAHDGSVAMGALPKDSNLNRLPKEVTDKIFQDAQKELDPVDVTDYTVTDVSKAKEPWAFQGEGLPFSEQIKHEI